MDNKNIKVSVITVAFNSEKTIGDTMQSVFNQSYDNIEYIIVDGCSSDSTTSLIQAYEEKFLKANKTFRWISERDNGIYDAINKGIRMASGDIIGILNSDDYFYDDSVLRDVTNEFKEREIDCLYGNLVYIDPYNNKIVRRWISKLYKKGLFEKSWTPAHPTFYCSKELYETIGYYRTDFKIAADVELMYRFLDKRKVKYSYLDRFMVTMRQGGVSSNGIRSTILITKEMKIAIEENGGNFNLLKYLFYKILKLKEMLILK